MTNNDAKLVFTSTYSSWLHWIEADFPALRYFTFNDSDYQSHAEQGAATRSCVRWRNHRAAPPNATLRSTSRSEVDHPPVA